MFNLAIQTNSNNGEIMIYLQYNQSINISKGNNKILLSVKYTEHLAHKSAKWSRAAIQLSHIVEKLGKAFSQTRFHSNSQLLFIAKYYLKQCCVTTLDRLYMNGVV